MSSGKAFSHSRIAILDFGSQYTQVIARRVRECRVYSEILPHHASAKRLSDFVGIILSGGPASVFSAAAPKLDPAIFSLGIPVLGICYGVQLMAFHLGGSVEFSDRREYGAGSIKIVGQSDLFQSLPSEFQVISCRRRDRKLSLRRRGGYRSPTFWITISSGGRPHPTRKGGAGEFPLSDLRL